MVSWALDATLPKDFPTATITEEHLQRFKQLSASKKTTIGDWTTFASLANIAVPPKLKTKSLIVERIKEVCNLREAKRAKATSDAIEVSQSQNDIVMLEV